MKGDRSDERRAAVPGVERTSESRPLDKAPGSYFEQERGVASTAICDDIIEQGES
jgi:hypothetical protein